MNGNIEEIVKSAIDNGVFPGIVMLVEKDREVVLRLVKGHRQFFPVREVMTGDTVFDLASLTKPLSTAVLIMNVLQREKIELDRKIGDFLPEMGPLNGKVSLLQLLVHISGLNADPAIYKRFHDPDAVDIKKAESELFSVERTYSPGAEVVYSCTGYLILGVLLERLTGMRIRELFERVIAAPCRLSNMLFNPPAAVKVRSAATEFCLWRKRWIRGEVHDENACCFGGDAGNAGLFGTAAEVLELLNIFTNRGVLRGVPIITEEAVRLMTSCQTPGMNGRRSVGFMMQSSDSPAGIDYGQSSYGHTGFTGTSVWVDPEAGLKVVVLTNRVHLGREATAEKITGFRREIHSAVYRAF